MGDGEKLLELLNLIMDLRCGHGSRIPHLDHVQGIVWIDGKRRKTGKTKLLVS
jgi:hypothetical protein